ncbi:MAG: cytochrome c [Gammaproteobacteria bacterium]|jgi:cytochrome c556|nr:cytochrome c [Gammaproteobacteria bacterium]
MRKLSCLAVSLFLGLSVGSMVLAAEPEDIIKYRKAVMKSMGGHVGAINQIVRGKVDYNHIRFHSEALAAALGTVGDLFPPDSDFGETAALPAVWAKRTEFEKHAQHAANDGAQFLAVVKAGDSSKYGPAFKTVLDGCKGCHDDFREKKD